MKRCKKCGVKKDITEFYPHKTNKDRLFGRCKACETELKAKNQREDRKVNPLKYKGYDLTKSFDLSLEQYQEQWRKQNGVCAICKQPESHVRLGKLTMLRVDHSHVTGKNRALLCNSCNAGLGYFLDSPELLTTAAKYLKLFE